MTDDEIELAGNGNHEMRSWVAVAGVMGGAPADVLAYEPIYAVDHGHGRGTVGHRTGYCQKRRERLRRGSDVSRDRGRLNRNTRRRGDHPHVHPRHTHP